MNPSTRIKQPWLSLVRLVWISLALYNLLPGLLNLPGVYLQLIALDPLPNNEGWTQAKLSAAVAHAGLNPQLVAWIILVPILIPVLGQYHVDLTHFGIVLLINLTIGQLTPPVGVLLFVSSSITKVPFRVIAREVLPYIAVLVTALMVLTYVPGVSLWLPAVIYK